MSSHSLIEPFVLQLMSPIQEELPNKGVKFFLSPLLTRSTRITQQGSQVFPYYLIEQISFIAQDARSRRITQQRGSGQSPFKKNHSTVGFGPIPVQEESLNSGVRANPCSRRITQQWGSRRSAFRKNCATRQQFRLVLNDFELDVVNYALRSA